MNKKNMNKINIALVSLAVLALPVMALAQLQPQAVGVGGVPQIVSLSSVITYIENAMAMIFSAIAVIMFIVAGILFLTAGGVPEKVQAARSAFLWGIAGVIVGIIAFSIVAIVSSMIGG